jgi:hypothetical protein
MIDIRIRKYALIEVIMKLENDSDLSAMEKVAATLTSVAKKVQKTTKPTADKTKKNGKHPINGKETEALASRFGQTMDLEEIKRKQNYKPIDRAELDRLID